VKTAIIGVTVHFCHPNCISWASLAIDAEKIFCFLPSCQHDNMDTLEKTISITAQLLGKLRLHII
jgi:hypothetical protein